MKKNKIGLGLGSNLGNRAENIQMAVELLKSQAIFPIKQSSFYETAPIGFDSNYLFINAVLLCETNLSAHEVLFTILNIEQQMGRTRSADGYIDRIIDIDFLFSETTVINDPTLVLPHPKLHERIFVLEPLAEIYPEWEHPLLRLKALELLKALK